MRAINSVGPRDFKAFLSTLGLTYLLLLHYCLFSCGYSTVRVEVRRFSDSLLMHARDAMRIERCPLHHSVLYEGIAQPAEIPAATRLIYRRPEIDYCGFYMSSLPTLEELPFPGIFYPDTVPIFLNAPASNVKICDECRRTAFIYLEPHYGMYRGADSLWRLPTYSLISPPRPSPPQSSRSIAAMR